MNKAPSFSFDNLPNSVSNFEEGFHELTILKVEEVYSKNNNYMYQFSYSIKDCPLQLNYDNCPLIDEHGNVINFGSSKLKKILSAVGVTPKEFTINTIRPLLVGKSFIARLEKNDKGYPRMCSKLDDILPLSSKDPATAQTMPKKQPPVDVITDEQEVFGAEETVLNFQNNDNNNDW